MLHVICCSILQYFVIHSTVLQYILQYTAVHWQYVVIRCTILQYMLQYDTTATQKLSDNPSSFSNQCNLPGEVSPTCTQSLY